jgi:transmembrane sensor
MSNIDKHTDKDWEKLASLLSGETTGTSDELDKFREQDLYGTEKQWNEMGKMGKDKMIDVDRAWNKVYSRLDEDGLLTKTVRIESRFNARVFMRIAAAAIVLIGLGVTMFYLFNSRGHSVEILVAANGDQRNVEVLLPDGSKAYLNRNSQISYSKEPWKSTRNIKLKGEAFFDISKDPSRPFIIDAGKATVKVLGTSFSVLTSNSNDAVEVFVKTGKVMVSDISGIQNMVLEPGFVGTMDARSSAKSLNENPNYLSWNTDLIVFERNNLNVVFSDLKKVFDIDVVADNPEILNELITARFDKQPQDTIIRIICTTFNFGYKKEGTVYHLSKK